MFGINKNGTKHKIGIIMPAFYPAERISGLTASIEFTTPSSGNYMQITLPTGFTTTNCIPQIPQRVLRGGYNGDYFNTNNQLYVYYEGANAYVYFVDSLRSTNWKITFLKIS